MKENHNHAGTESRSDLYPPLEPFYQQVLDVPGGHQIYVEQCGRPDGVPVVVLHGGPGGGCSPGMRRFFDPEQYPGVVLDPRGWGRSKPHASVENNTTWDLVADIERIRRELGIARWTVFGGSWGACLALIYAQTHPQQVRSLVLRGVFTMTRAEIDWFYGGNAGAFWPEQWSAFSHMVPEDERHDLVAAYNKRLFGENEIERSRFARAWAGWESSVAVLEPGERRGMPSGPWATAFALLENHYFINKGFLKRNGQIMADMHRLAGVPGHIVQGRYDMICPPKTAIALHEAWPGSTLNMVPTAGHALSEPGISAALVAHMDSLRG
jgi:proline iminopeptidase